MSISKDFIFKIFLSFSSIFSKTEKVIHEGRVCMCRGKNMWESYCQRTRMLVCCLHLHVGAPAVRLPQIFGVAWTWPTLIPGAYLPRCASGI
jgi:hypothetical protein